MKQKPIIPCSKKFFKILEKAKKEKLDKYDCHALYLWDKVFKNDPEYQSLRKKIKVKSKRPGLSLRMQRIKKKMESWFNQKLWDDLGKKCIECGRCSLVCPTCFCFRFEDQASGTRGRVLDSCFYHDFSEVAGGHRFLDSTARRIYFWYYHKFVRIPEQYNLPGCLECGRCIKACPVGIDIGKVLKEILKT